MQRNNIEAKLEELAKSHANTDDFKVKRSLDFKCFQYLADKTNNIHRRDREGYQAYYVARKLEYNHAKK